MQIIFHIEKGMSKKKAFENLGAPKNTISNWMKNKKKLLINCKRLHGVVITKKLIKLYMIGSFYKEVSKHPLGG